MLTFDIKVPISGDRYPVFQDDTEVGWVEPGYHSDSAHPFIAFCSLGNGRVTAGDTRCGAFLNALSSLGYTGSCVQFFGERVR